MRCKWPIHVFALDPVVDQQNILDAYSRRTELAGVPGVPLVVTDARQWLADQLDEMEERLGQAPDTMH